MLKNKKHQFIYFSTIMAVTAAAMGTANTAFAEVGDEDKTKSLAPIIMFVLDTSGSMCDGADGTVTSGEQRCDKYPNDDDATNRYTKLSKAIADLTGTPRLAPSEIGTDTVELPRSQWTCDKTSQECKYIKTKKEFKGVSKINTDLVDATGMNYENAYNPDGILQRYQNKAKFGFAGMANGTSNAVVDDPSKRQIEEMGGDTDVALRFTIIWNEKENHYSENQNRDDNDLHVQEWKYNPPNDVDKNNEDAVWQAYKSNRGSYSKGDHIYYGNHKESNGGSRSELGGILDVDKCISSCSNGYTETASAGCPSPAGENIQYKTTYNMHPGDKFYYYINHYTYCNDKRNGFTATSSLGGCAIYKITYKDTGSFPWHCESSFTFNGKTNRYSTSYTNSRYGCIEIGVATYKGHGKFDFEFLYTNNNGGIYASKYQSKVAEGTELSDLSEIHMYGYHPFTRGDGVTVGMNLQNKPYKKQKDCTQDLGMWDADLETPAPLFYPTISDDPDMILKSNQSLIEMVRSYRATAATPIGEVLADLYYMFGGQDINDNNKYWQPTATDTRGDQGLYKQKFNYNDPAPDYDEDYACRQKAVVFITDGKPVGSGVYASNPSSSSSTSADFTKDENGHGFRDNVWYDADHLRKIGVKVYVVAYGEDFSPADFDTLDRMAFNGGTCYNPDTLKLFDPDTASGENGKDAFETMITKNTCIETRACLTKNASASNEIKKEKCGTATMPSSSLCSESDTPKHCFFDARDTTSNALAKALDSIISKILVSSVSKTRVATTTSIGLKTNYIDGKYHNGFYTVYSGYESTQGLIRNTKLQRETTRCEDGEFETHPIKETDEATESAKDDWYIDLAERLSLRTNSNMKKVKQKDANGEETGLYEVQYISDSSLCANNDKDHIIPSGMSNTCLTNRYIFAGDYYTADTTSTSIPPRYRLAPKNAHLTKKSTDNHYIVGSFKQGHASGDYHFLEEQINNEESCAEVKNKNINVNYNTANYILSPYQCMNDYDCGIVAGETQRCDLGRCIKNSEFSSMSVCDQMSSPVEKTSTSVCIAGFLRELGTIECNQHSDCTEQGEGATGSTHDDKDQTFVCHAGKCLPGTILKCDQRQFIASQPLGTIEYASPVVVEPPRRNYRNASYKEFSKKYWLRDTMLLVGANDGMLHNFILGKNNDKEYTSADVDEKIQPDPKTSLSFSKFEEGDELWAFIPKTVMPNLYQLTKFGAQHHINATPYVADVMDPTEEDYKNSWKTVVVGGFREGGRGYYALDISDPGKPKILWEIDNQWQYHSNPDKTADNYVFPDMAGNNGSVTTLDETNYPFQRMGNSYPEPIIANVAIKTTTSGKTTYTLEPVAILPGGMNDSENADDNDYVGKALYIVRLFPRTPDKLLVKRYDFPNKVTGSPAVYPNNFNSIAQLIYVGDASGALYRIDLTDGIDAGSVIVTDSEIGTGETIPNHYTKDDNDLNVLQPIFAPSMLGTNVSFDRITYRPAVSLYDSNQGIIQIAFGSGANDNLNIQTTNRNYAANFYDYRQGNHYQLANRDTPKSQFISFSQYFTLSGSENHIKDFNQNDLKITFYTKDPLDNTKQIATRQKMSGAPIIYNYDTYFPTFITKTDPSNPCTIEGNAAIWKLSGSDSETTSRRHGTVASNVQNTTEESAQPFTNSSIYELALDGTKIYGLAITPQLYCAGSEKSTTLAPQLVALTGLQFSDSHEASSGTQKLRPQNTEVQSFAMNLDAMNPNVTQLSWASVYE